MGVSLRVLHTSDGLSHVRYLKKYLTNRILCEKKEFV